MMVKKRVFDFYEQLEYNLSHMKHRHRFNIKVTEDFDQSDFWFKCRCGKTKP
jgi:hypothetical protein